MNAIEKNIKRYLKQISTKVNKSSTNESIHYYVHLEDRILDIRFSEHFTSKNRIKNVINIIKISEDFYRIHYEFLQINAEANKVTSILKSLLNILIFLDPSKDYIKKLTKQYNSINNNLNIITNERDKYKLLLENANIKENNLLEEIKNKEVIINNYEQIINKNLELEQSLNNKIVEQKNQLDKLSVYIKELINISKKLQGI